MHYVIEVIWLLIAMLTITYCMQLTTNPSLENTGRIQRQHRLFKDRNRQTRQE